MKNIRNYLSVITGIVFAVLIFMVPHKELKLFGFPFLPLLGAMEVRERKQTTVEYLLSGRVSKPLSRGSLYRELYVRLRHAPTVTAANNIPSQVKRGDAWGIIKKLEIVGNGSDVIRSFSGLELFHINKLLFGNPPKLMPTYGDALTANPSCDLVLAVPFWSIGTNRPLDTALNSSLLSDLRIEIEWGDTTDLYSAGVVSNTWTTTPTLEVYTLESFPENPTEIILAGTRVNRQIAQPAAAATDFRVDLSLGALYRGLLINFASAAGVDEPTRLNNIKIKSGSTVFFDMPRAVLEQSQLLRVGRTFGVMGRSQLTDNSTGVVDGVIADVGGAFAQATLNANFADITRRINQITAYPNIMASSNYDNGAWYWLDFVTDGFLTEAIDTFNLGEFFAEFDVTGATNITIIPLQIFPARKGSGV